MALLKLARSLIAVRHGLDMPSYRRTLSSVGKLVSPADELDDVTGLAEPDDFGNLSRSNRAISVVRYPDEASEPEDAKESKSSGFRRLSPVGRRHDPIWYGRQIEKLGKNGKIAEAIRLVEVDMLEKDRVMPTPYVFTVLIGVLGRAGYSKKAFQLFNKMKAMGLEPEEPTYTALFNACANSPWSEDGLQRASQLRQLMRAKDVTPSRQTYGAMVKAMAKCGQPGVAFEIVDEMLASGLKPDAVTFSSIMMACLNDKACGFRLMVGVWKALLNSGIKPDSYHYNLLLGAAERCGVGDVSLPLDLRPLLNGFLDNGRLSTAKRLASRRSTTAASPRASFDAVGTQIVDRAVYLSSPSAANSTHSGPEPVVSGLILSPPYRVLQAQTDSMPIAAPAASSESDGSRTSLLSAPSGTGRAACSRTDAAAASDSQRQSDVAVSAFNGGTASTCVALRTPTGRLEALGGIEGLLRRMDDDGAQPDSRTFTMLLHMLPLRPAPAAAAAAQRAEDDRGCSADVVRAMEEHLLNAADRRRVALDATFFARLARRRAMSGDRAAAVDVLRLMSERRLDADVQTFACIAMSCHGSAAGMELLQTMKEVSVRPNIVVFNILMDRARLDFIYRVELCKAMEAFDVKPDRKFVDIVSKVIARAKRRIVQQEKGLSETLNSAELDKMKKGFATFMLYYAGWQKRMPPDTERHPWQDFRRKNGDTEALEEPAVAEP